MTTPTRARAAAERLSRPSKPIPAPLYERRTRTDGEPPIEDRPPARRRRPPVDSTPEYQAAFAGWAEQQHVQHAPRASSGTGWGVIFLILGGLIGALAWRNYGATSAPLDLGVPTAAVAISHSAPAPTYDNAAWNRQHAAPEAPAATEAAPTPDIAPAPQNGAEAASQGGQAEQAGAILVPVAPLIRATETAAPAARVEAAPAVGGQAREAGSIAARVASGAPQATEEGGTAAGAGSFMTKVGKP